MEDLCLRLHRRRSIFRDNVGLLVDWLGTIKCHNLSRKLTNYTEHGKYGDPFEEPPATAEATVETGDGQQVEKAAKPGGVGLRQRLLAVFGLGRIVDEDPPPAVLGSLPPVREHLEQQVRESQRLLVVANTRSEDAERRAAEASHQLWATQHRLQECERLLEEANHRCQGAERRLSESEHRLQGMLQEAQRRNQELTAENGRLQGDLQKMERRQQAAQSDLQGRTRELAAHNTEVWRIPSNKVDTLRPIGTGGWGEVLEGTVRVAIKRLHPAILNQRNLERLQREMRLLAEVRHPNLVQFIGAVFDQSPPLIIAELLDMNLCQAYEENQLQPGNCLSIFIDIARALDYLHQRYEPIIHRDVSAPNVLLQRMPNNQWKGNVSDLGSANFLQDARTMGEGAIVYSPPEVIPQAHDPRARPPRQTVKIDVYSYGVVLCEVHTSRFPKAEDYHDMIAQVEREKPRLHGLILACTKRDPSDRLSMAEVLVELGKMAPF